MSFRDSRASGDCGESTGLGGFLRSLLSGIPWSDRADREEVFDLATPQSGRVKVVNANGKTRIRGEERDDIEVRAHKIARAETDEAAKRLLDEIRVHATQVGDSLEIEVEIPKRWNRHGNVHLDVRLPRDQRVSVRTRNGKLCLEGMRRSVRTRSSNGPIHVNDVIGDIELVTSNAKVSCSCTCWRLHAR